MENNIKISVVIPVYNTAVFLAKCLESLHSQKYGAVEFILVDDGSTDNSLAICREFEKADDRFVVITKENAGPSSARNLAISAARGEYITFVDSDDYLRAGTYERIAALLEQHKNPDCLIFGAELIPSDAPQYMKNLVTTRNVVYNEFSPKMLFEEVGSRPFLWLQVVKSSIIKDNKIVMDESIQLGEDQLFQMEFLPLCKKTVYVSDKLYFYRWKRAGSIMHVSAKKLAEKLMLHVDLVDKVFTLMKNKYPDEEMLYQTLSWSIFFIWGDIIWLLEEEQNKVAAKLKGVWEKHGYEKLLDKLNPWAVARLDNILLLAIENKDERIEALAKANLDMKEKVEAFCGTKEYKYAMSMSGELSKLGKLKKNLKEIGLFGTAKKVIKKLLKK